MISGETLSKYFQIAMLVILSAVLILWPYVEPFIPDITVEQSLGILVAIITGMFLYFDSRLSSAIRAPTRTITPMSLNDCFNQVSKMHKHVRHMRIYALSTGRINPLFSSSDLFVDKCEILVRDFGNHELENPKNAERRRHINDMISEWEKEKRKGRIGELSITRFHYMPTEYYVTFDDKTMILGLFQPTADNWGDVIEPVFIQGTSTEGAEMMEKYRRRFDRMMEMLTEEQGS
jgi:hypothetical protein